MGKLTYSEAHDYLFSFIDYERTTQYDYDRRSMNLDRMRALLDLLGSPHHRLRCVHIGGTNGKGSTAAMVTSILSAAGYTVGLYTQPHLITIRERMRVGREMISEVEVCDHVERLRPCVDQLSRQERLGDLTFFEVWTALTMDYFAKKRVDYAVIEVGLGGRLDATNVIIPLVSAITTIGIDHTHKLGDTLAQIAGEKAAIIKEGGVVASSPQADEVARVIHSRCESKGARLVELGRDVKFERTSSSANGQTFDLMGELGNHRGLSISLLGKHQIINAALAVTITDLLKEQGVSIPEDVLRDGLRSTQWPGRLQIVGSRPTILLDGGHNQDAARALREAIEEVLDYRRLVLVFGICVDKKIREVWRELENLTDVAVLTKADLPRAAEPSTIVQEIRETKVEIILTESVPAALDVAKSIAEPEDLICVTGSFFVVGEAMEHLGVDVESRCGC